MSAECAEWLERKPVPHAVRIHTHFGDAAWINPKLTKIYWLLFLHCFIAVYIAHSTKIEGDQEHCVTSSLSYNLWTAIGIELRLSLVEVHNAIRIGKRYHVPLQRVYHALWNFYLGRTARVTLSLP